MKLVAAMLALVLLGSLLASQRFLAQPDTYVVGGTYVIRSGDVLPGNLRAVFAQVIIEEGARVSGRILALSSTLDLSGAVSGAVLAVGSDVTVRQTARLGSAPRRTDILPYVFLLPQILRVGSGAHGSR